MKQLNHLFDWTKYKISESDSSTNEQKLNQEALSEMLTNLLRDKKLMTDETLSHLLESLISTFFMKQFLEYFKDKHPKLVLLERMNGKQLQIDMGKFLPSLSNWSWGTADERNINLLLVNMIFDKEPQPRKVSLKYCYYKNGVFHENKHISANSIVNNFSSSEKYKFKNDFFQEIDELIIDGIVNGVGHRVIKLLLWATEKTASKIMPLNQIMSIDQALPILKKDIPLWSEMLPEIVDPILQRCSKLNYETQSLAIIREELPELFEVIKKNRSSEHTWKTDLQADLGDLGF